MYVKLWYSGHSGKERGLISRTAAGNHDRAPWIEPIDSEDNRVSSPDAEIVVHLAPCWKIFVHRPYKMLAVLGISMRSLFMQEFSPYICMFLEGQPGHYHGTLAHATQLLQLITYMPLRCLS